MLLILDLDDTIFETKSIPIQVVKAATDIIEAYFIEKYGEGKSQNVICDLWKIPFDVAAKKHSIPKGVQASFLSALRNIDFDLDIRVYSDYAFLKSMPFRKILVTTGFGKLQKAKISALNIAIDFESIHIDDPFESERKYKKGIFQEILSKNKFNASDVWVIGDNPASELEAGYALGLHTIQRIKKGEEKAVFVEQSIYSFEELKDFSFQA